MRVLIVEDHAKMAVLLRRLLHGSGYVVDAVGSLDEASAALAVARYDAILLDLSLPDGDGRDLLRRLRRAHDGVPVLVATARDGLNERVALLDEGADDYLVKPFSPDELLARLRAVLRRQPALAPRCLSFANLTLDVEGGALRVGEASVEVSHHDVAILGALLRNQGRLTSREQLAEALYSLDDAVTPNAIEAAISRLRRRLEAHGATAGIVSMRGLGYALAGQPAA